MFGIRRRLRRYAMLAATSVVAIGVGLVALNREGIASGLLPIAGAVLAAAGFFFGRKWSRPGADSLELLNRRREVDRLKGQSMVLSWAELTPKLISMEANYALWDYQKTELERWNGDCWNEYIGVIRYEFTAHYGVDLRSIRLTEADGQITIYNLTPTQEGVTREKIEPKLREIRTFTRGGLLGNEPMVRIDQSHARLLELSERQIEQLKGRARGGAEIQPVLEAARKAAEQMLVMVLSANGRTVAFSKSSPPPGALDLGTYLRSRGETLNFPAMERSPEGLLNYGQAD